MDPKQHWESIYTSKRATDVSWYQSEARLSLSLIQRVAPDVHTALVDVGGGASTLVDGLLAAGYTHVTVLDISPAALRLARERLGPSASRVTWREGSVMEPLLPEASVKFWHDRAVFHFLTEAKDRARYVDRVIHALCPGGHMLIASFAEDGPRRCSGLDVVRYSASALHTEFGEDFQMILAEREIHTTPAGVNQAFQYCLLRYLPRDAVRHEG